MCRSTGGVAVQGVSQLQCRESRYTAPQRLRELLVPNPLIECLALTVSFSEIKPGHWALHLVPEQRTYQEAFYPSRQQVQQGMAQEASAEARHDPRCARCPEHWGRGTHSKCLHCGSANLLEAPKLWQMWNKWKVGEVLSAPKLLLN